MKRVRVRSFGVGLLLFACGAKREPSLVPGYTLRGDVSGAVVPEALSNPSKAPSAEAASSIGWSHVAAVSGWSEIFRGKTSGHLFSGSANATVSTRVSSAAVLDVLRGVAEWGTLAPGDAVSQLVLSEHEPNEWIAAYVIQRRSDAEASAAHTPVGASAVAAPGLVSYTMVLRDGTIDETAGVSCAACHASR